MCCEEYTKLKVHFEEHNIDGKYHIYTIEKELCESILNSAVQKKVTDFFPEI